jgi:hypothetical protein
MPSDTTMTGRGRRVDAECDPRAAIADREASVVRNDTTLLFEPRSNRDSQPAGEMNVAASSLTQLPHPGCSPNDVVRD